MRVAMATRAISERIGRARATLQCIVRRADSCEVTCSVIGTRFFAECKCKLILTLRTSRMNLMHGEKMT